MARHITALTGSDCSSYAANNFLGYPAYTKKLHKKNKCDSSIKHWQARGYTLELNNLTSKLKANSDPAMKTLSQLTIAPRLLLLNVLRICELFSLNLPAALETCSMFIATNSVNLSSVSAAGIQKGLILTICPLFCQMSSSLRWPYSQCSSERWGTQWQTLACCYCKFGVEKEYFCA